MKLIFLDIDGVFNSVAWYKKRGSSEKMNWDETYEFDPETVNLFNKIIKATQAKIVVSSCWRKGNIKYLKDLFKMVGIGGEVIDETIRLYWGDQPYPNVNIPRGLEIKQYLWNIAQDVETYCIIDDSSDMLYGQRDNFIQTDMLIGLTSKDVNNVIDILCMEG